MQQWLDVIQAAGDLLAFAAALTNLTIAITSRRRHSSGERLHSDARN
jgi:hypothetical protein